MTTISQPFRGVHLLAPTVFKDDRGDFVKTFHRGIFESLGIAFDAAEEFFSTSHRGVLRGMHFQLPPHQHSKLVYCVRGRVMDVIVDLRRKELTFGQAASAELSRENSRVFYLPAGIAHGFLALEDDSVMVYKTSTVHAPSHDTGIRWDSFGFDWGVVSPKVSAKDTSLPVLGAFDSPF